MAEAKQRTSVPRIAQAVDQLEDHAFFRRIESIFEIAQPASSIHFFPDGTQKSPFPVVNRTYQGASPAEIELSDAAENLVHYGRNVRETLRKLNLTLSLASQLRFDEETWNAALMLEYLMENYYLRLPTILEQIYVVASIFLPLHHDFRRPIHEFEKLLARRAPSLSEAVRAWKGRVHFPTARQTRHLIAHLDDFQMEDYDGIQTYLGLARMHPDAERERFLKPESTVCQGEEPGSTLDPHS